MLLMIYIAFRFTPRFAPGAVVALIHDVAITSAVWIVFQLEFDLRVLAALLAVLGYSLNDTIVVYDRIRENLALHTKSDLVDVLNRSVNETLSRTLLTGVTSLVAVLRAAAVRRRGGAALRARDADRHRGGHLLVGLHRLADAALARALAHGRRDARRDQGASGEGLRQGRGPLARPRDRRRPPSRASEAPRRGWTWRRCSSRRRRSASRLPG